jgi:threonine synthase
MSFFSTRGESCVTASQAILRGIAPDGGLYVPAMFQAVQPERLTSLMEMSYEQRAVAVLKRFLEDFSLKEIEDSVRAAYSRERFTAPEVAPVRQLDSATWALELFHGPTLAFKDMALQLLPHLLKLSAEKNGEDREICILVATSGDTGKAALEGFRDVPGTSCTVFYPLDGVSDVQRLQMVTTGGNNTHVIAVRGNFDDAQTGVKELFGSESFREEMAAKGRTLSSANSINLGRLVPQVVYYFSAYAELLKTNAIPAGEPVNFCVPTGNFGNILAGWYAKQLGLPVRKFICASNENKVLTDFLNTGVYDIAERPFHVTESPSMDILISSNLERLLYHLSGRDGAEIRRLMTALETEKRYEVPETIREGLADFAAGYAETDEAEAAIRRYWEEHAYLMDTHTAVAAAVYDAYRAETGDETPTVIVSTASPYKFAEAVSAAIGLPERENGFAALTALAEATRVPVPAGLVGLDRKDVRHPDVCDIGAMPDAVRGSLR